MQGVATAGATAKETNYASVAWSQFVPLVVVFVIFIILLLAAPQGLFGASATRRV